MDKKNILRSLLFLALPVMLQNLITAGLNLVDTMMIGQLGEVRIAAVGLANQYYFIFSLLLFGVNSGIAIFTAQYFGKDEIDGVRKSVGLALSISIISSLVFAIGAIGFSRTVMEIFSKDPLVVQDGMRYLKVIGFSYTFTALSYALSFSLRAIGQPKIPLMISSVALLTNTVLNFGLILGNFGLPALGVQGAAIATLIARTIECSALLFFLYKSKHILLAGKENFTFSKSFITRVAHTSGLVVVNEFLWSIGMSTVVIAYASVGTEAAAAVQIANTIQNLFIVAGYGVANASAVLLGQSLGSGYFDRAIKQSRLFMITGFLFGATLGIGLIFSRESILRVYQIEAGTQQSIRSLLLIMALFMGFKILNTTISIGVLRSGGDTKYAFFVDTGSVWLAGVPAAFFAAYVLHLSIPLVYLFASSMDVFRFLAGVPRALSNKWVRNLVGGKKVQEDGEASLG
jgi:putative MATE family efflux protein